jgi:hypothetical protein
MTTRFPVASTAMFLLLMAFVIWIKGGGQLMDVFFPLPTDAARDGSEGIASALNTDPDGQPLAGGLFSFTARDVLMVLSFLCVVWWMVRRKQAKYKASVPRTRFHTRRRGRNRQR